MAEPLRLLIVEDSEDDAVLIEAALRRGGLAIDAHRVADEAGLSHALAHRRWDVLITDYVLPELDGLEVLSILRRSGADVPAILVSGKIGEPAAVEALRAGARDYVAKENLARLAPAVRRELEEAASRRERRAAEVKYAVAFRSSPHAMVLTSAKDGRYLEINEAFEKLTGYSREAALGRTTVEFGAWPDGDARQHFLDELTEHGSVRDLEYPVRRKDGRVLETRLSSELVELPEGRAILSVVQDVTESKRAREALEHSEERFSKAFFANPNPALISTLDDGTILEVNEVLSSMLGWDRRELVGRHGVEVGLWSQAHASEMTRLLEASGTARDLELRVRGRDGKHYDLLVSAVVVEIGGEPCVLNVAVDITERKQLQAQLLRAQRLESIGTLAGGIAHDLNNVLTPILMAMKLLRQNQPEQRERVLSILESNAHRGADLIRQLLSFARGAEGRRVLVDVESVVEDVAGIVRDTFPKSIDLALDVEPGLWTAEGDPTQFQQVLLNLAVNARDAMEGKGQLTIAARNRVSTGAESGPPGAETGSRWVEIEVVDSGPGIPEELRRQVFDPFFTTKGPGLGTGLGLFSVESIVASHGGSVTVADGPGRRGARVVVRLPMAGSRTTEAARSALVRAPPGRGELVLVVDDEDAVREIAAGVLEASGYRTIPAADGRTALRRLEERGDEVRAVVVDMMMPGMGGEETVAAIRRLYPELPIIAMSGIDSGSGHTEPPPGADLFLHKPLTAEELLGSLRRLLGRDGEDGGEEPHAGRGLAAVAEGGEGGVP